MRGLTGSVVGNLLLVLGFSLLFGGRGEIDRVELHVPRADRDRDLLLLVPSIPGWDGDEPTRSPCSRSRSRSCSSCSTSSSPGSRCAGTGSCICARSLPAQRLVLRAGCACGCSGWQRSPALIAEALVGSLETFAHDAGLSEFFVAAVIVAIVGNAAEHGGAVVVAYRGRIKLAAEIALASSALGSPSS